MSLCNHMLKQVTKQNSKTGSSRLTGELAMVNPLAEGGWKSKKQRRRPPQGRMSNRLKLNDRRPTQRIKGQEEALVPALKRLEIPARC